MNKREFWDRGESERLAWLSDPDRTDAELEEAIEWIRGESIFWGFENERAIYAPKIEALGKAILGNPSVSGRTFDAWIRKDRLQNFLSEEADWRLTEAFFHNPAFALLELTGGLEEAETWPNHLLYVRPLAVVSIALRIDLVSQVGIAPLHARMLRVVNALGDLIEAVPHHEDLGSVKSNWRSAYQALNRSDALENYGRWLEMSVWLELDRELKQALYFLGLRGAATGVVFWRWARAQTMNPPLDPATLAPLAWAFLERQAYYLPPPAQ